MQGNSNITYRRKLTKDNKQDSNETGNKYKGNKTLNQRNKNNVMGKSIYSPKAKAQIPEKTYII